MIIANSVRLFSKTIQKSFRFLKISSENVMRSEKPYTKSENVILSDVVKKYQFSVLMEICREHC